MYVLVEHPLKYGDEVMLVPKESTTKKTNTSSVIKNTQSIIQDAVIWFIVGQIKSLIGY
jgi:hypothetical protein